MLVQQVTCCSAEEGLHYIMKDLEFQCQTPLNTQFVWHMGDQSLSRRGRGAR
jgi:hypothetical protein